MLCFCLILDEKNSMFDRSVMEQMVLNGGGKIVNEINPFILSKQKNQYKSRTLREVTNLNKDCNFSLTHDHIALVSSECCQTLKYLQVLATLGRVPILRTEWLIDSFQNSRTNDNINNWPLHLLHTNPGKYELPRGFIGESNDFVEWWVIFIN